MAESIIVAASVSQPGIISSACPWASLPTDLLLDISGRLHDARDFLRFHAVCRPWRDAATSRLSPPVSARHAFLPWLISKPNVNLSLMHSPVIYFGGLFSEATSEDIWRKSHRYEGNALPVWSFSDTSWVASADGEAVWDFCLSPGGPSLTDLVTGAVKRLPLFSDDDNYDLERRMRKPRGVFYADGTVLLYSFVPEENRRYGLKKPVFTAVILRPGEIAWTIVEKSLNGPVEDYSCAAYHGGKVLVWVGTPFWCFVTQQQQQQQQQDVVEAHYGRDISAGVRLEMTTCDRIIIDQGRYNNDHNYVFESCGELFWVSVLIEHEWIRTNTSAMCNGDFVVPALVVMVHALEEEEEEEEEEADAGVGIGKMRWVERDGLSLGDRLLFLGLPASFTMDATQMGTDGGCAYFVYRHRVFRYNLVDGKTHCVDWPCCGWISPDVHVWLRPQPVIASIQEIY